MRLRPDRIIIGEDVRKVLSVNQWAAAEKVIGMELEVRLKVRRHEPIYDRSCRAFDRQPDFVANDSAATTSIGSLLVLDFPASSK